MELFPIYLLESLVAFYERGTIGGAAEKLQVTQPAVTKHLQKLEALSPQAIFITIGRKKTLTSFGEQLCQRTQGHLRELAFEIERLEMGYSNGQGVTLKLGGRHEFLVRFFEGLTNFKGTLQYVSLSSRDVIAHLLEKKLDLAITHITHDRLEYVQKKICSDHACLIVPLSWKTPESAKAFFKGCNRWPTAIFSKDLLQSGISKSILQALPALDIRIEISDWKQIESWVSQQKIWAIVPQLFCRPDRGYRIIDLREWVPFQTYFLYYRPDLAKLDWFKEILKQII
jgi:DNA-binding transcriptional LysR family regulator